MVDQSFDALVNPPQDLSPLAVAEMFAAVGRHLADQPDPAATLRTVCEIAVRVVPGARWVSVTRGRGEAFTTLAASEPTALEADRLQYRLGTGPCVDAVVEDAVFDSADLARDPRWSQFGPQAAQELGVHSVLSLRLRTMDDDDLSSALNLYGAGTDAFDSRSTLLATLLATHAAIAVELVAEREQSRGLRDALASNREIGVAMGVLMTTHRLTRTQAFDLLRVASQNTNRKLRHLATEVADTGVLELPRRPPTGHGAR